MHIHPRLQSAKVTPRIANRHAHIQRCALAGGSVNVVDAFGQTPLIAAVCRRFDRDVDALARLKLLLEHPRIDLSVVYDGMTAVEWAVELGRSNIAIAIALEVNLKLYAHTHTHMHACIYTYTLLLVCTAHARSCFISSASAVFL